jgi:hypothetical protein
MSHFAKVENGVVTQVIVAESDFISTGALGDPASWIQTSYNTHAGQHTNGGEPLHKNYAGIGYTWDGTGFAAPQPFESWSLNQDSYTWEAPTAMPTEGGPYNWDEATQSWVETVSA